MNSASSESPLRIFLVEDHECTRCALTRYLEHRGHTVLSATAMREALEALPEAGCAVLLSDICLPDGNGWELLKQVKSASPLFPIAMSGYARRTDCATSASVGYRGHLRKPFPLDELDALLAEAAQEMGCAKAAPVGSTE